MGEIKNILTAMGQSGRVQASTGVAECTIQIIQTMCLELGAIVSDEWTVMEDFKAEMKMLNQIIHQATRHVPTAHDTSTEPVSNPAFTSEQVLSDVPDIDPVLPANRTLTTTAQPSLNIRKDTEEIFALMNKAMEANDWTEVIDLLEDLILIINSDTGGQAEFLDLHASLVSGPSFNLLFSRLVDSLDSMFKIYYTNEEGISTAEEDSTMTVEEVMFQALASVACFSGSFSDVSAPAAKLLNYHMSKVMFVGTHRDRVSDEEFKAKDDFLKERITDTEFFKKDMIEFASEDQLMLSVDNYYGGPDEISAIRKRLESVIRRHFEKIDIPVAWLMLVFYIRSTKRRTMSLEMCEELAGKLNVGPEELQDALWFLHHCVGLILYYPELEVLKSTLICDIQVVFDSASNLIKNTFTFERFGKRVTKTFKEKGVFSHSDLEKAAASHTDSLLPLQHLVKLLEHLSILTPLPLSPGVTKPSYFMPCVLKCARASGLAVTRSASDPAPLMLRYQCGYVPVGVFPAMITNLVSQQSKLGWKMIEEGLRKNRVQFKVGRDFDTVTLISHPRYFEIAVVRLPDFEVPTNTLCCEVLDVVESTLGSVTSRMNYNFSMGYKFGFECPVHSTKDHICVVEDKEARRMECQQDSDVVPLLTESHRVWFPQRRPVKVSSSGAKGVMLVIIVTYCPRS
jgi:ankyrin